jgi:hypothetical protein
LAHYAKAKDAPAFPKPSPWQAASATTYTSTLSFTTDGRYHFALTSTDLAGNTTTIDTPAFALDQTAPLITISGVADRKAYRDEVAPSISITDDDFDRADTSLVLDGSKRGMVPLGSMGAWRDVKGGRTFTFKDFKRTQATDDIYTLEATSTDLAGNTTTSHVTFSVNRFGSTYLFSHALGSVVGSYVKVAPLVSFYEINVSPLRPDTTTVRLSHNGSASELSAASYSRTFTTKGDGWALYTYTLAAHTFAADGTYQVVVTDHDEAGNLNDNSAPHKDASIDFAVDDTAPVIIVPGISTDQSYDTQAKQVSATVRDNLRLKDVAVALAGKPIAYSHKRGTALYDFTIPEGSSAKDLVITASDMAGNTTTYTARDITVAASPLAALADAASSLPPSTGLLALSVVLGAIALGAIISGLVLYVRRKRAEEERAQAEAEGRVVP